MELTNLPAYSVALREKARAFDALANAIDDAFPVPTVEAKASEPAAPVPHFTTAERSVEKMPPAEMPATVPPKTLADIVLQIPSTPPAPPNGSDLVNELRRRLAAGEFGRAKEFGARMNVAESAIRQALQSPGSGIVLRHGWLKLSHVATAPNSSGTNSAPQQGQGLTLDTLRELVAINPAPVNQIARECSVSDSDILNLVQQSGSNLVIFHGKVMPASAIK